MIGIYNHVYAAPTFDPWEAFRMLAVAALMALTATGVTIEPTLSRSVFGWQVVAKLPQELMAQKEQLLSAAKAALLRAAERSQSCYVVGYGRAPFVSSPLGFSALLANVDDSSKACWDLLQHGFCEYEGCCRRQHPATRATLNVMVVPAPTAESAA